MHFFLEPAMRSFLLLLLAGLFPLSAYAYLDPGTGSLIIQSLIAAMVPVVAFWRSIKEFFARLFKKGKDERPS
jgi:hypothetical protein